jgi:hypothetical protein
VDELELAVENECPDCGAPLYDSGCDASGHSGQGCQECGYGCDYDLVPDEDSRCAALMGGAN